MSITFATIISLIVHSAPSLLDEIRKTILDKGREVAVDKSKALATTKSDEWIRGFFRLDEKEQIRHLEQALKNAVVRGLVGYETLTERDQYKDILYTLLQIGSHNEELRQEALKLFSFSDTPDLTNLNDKYNYRKKLSAIANKELYIDIDTTPYLTSFFNALLAELYADTYFRQQMSDALQQRTSKSIHQSLITVVSILQKIGETLEDNYSSAQLAQDVAVYIEHTERILHNMKLVGIVPKDKNRDPELEGIFVPVHITLKDHITFGSQFAGIDSIITALEENPYIVLLGGPGAGKSTLVRYLAWSLAAANKSASQTSRMSLSLVSGHPLPLRIELRRLSEERKQGNNYDFLSFAKEVLLKREGVEIDQRMFKELLSRRSMLLLFDGLDEVGALDERIRLVGEIEHFIMHYPGNRIVVTSRSVGYNLARFSNQMFSHAEILPFNTEQIYQFLHNWYLFVLGHSPIPQGEQQELDQLFKTLQNNTGLQTLAENPLLLTVITELHRYERLPDRRILIYDRCADLLLETWAKIKGTHSRWQNMKMVKEDQIACVAHLGFVLHKRLQEEIQRKGDNKEDEENADNIIGDVTTRVMAHEVERFLRYRNLIAEIAQQRTEAKLFIELMRVEAGLIVERGTDDRGELLYGFVHRTFQEYFAAVDVYERFQQEVDLRVINDYLVDYLHDPHWHEVTLLLFGKLNPRPATKVLTNLLLGKTISRRSTATGLLCQDLFFVCSCLIEEIAIENELGELVISLLRNIVEKSPFPTQRWEALNFLGKLMRTRQYKSQGQKALTDIAVSSSIITSKIDAIYCLYNYSTENFKNQTVALQLLASLFQRSEISTLQINQIVKSISSHVNDYNEKLFAVYVLTTLLQYPDLSVDQICQVTEYLYQFSSENSEGRHLALLTLSTLLQRHDLSVDQIRQTAETLYSIAGGVNEKQIAIHELTILLQRHDLSVDQIRQTAEFLYRYSAQYSDEERLASHTLSTLLQSYELSVDQIHEVAKSLYRDNAENSKERLIAFHSLSEWFQRADLSVDQVCQTANFLYRYSARGTQGRSLARNALTTLLQSSSISVDQICQIADSLSKSRSSDEERLARHTLLAL